MHKYCILYFFILFKNYFNKNEIKLISLKLHLLLPINTILESFLIALEDGTAGQ